MTNLTPERRAELRERVSQESNLEAVYWSIGGTTLATLLDAADERDRLASQQLDPSKLSIISGWLAVEVGHCNCGVSGGYFGAHERGCGLEDVLRLDTLPGWPGPREVPGVMEHGDTPCLIGASHPASDPCEYPCPATMPGHRCTRLEHAEGGHLWATTEEEWARLLAELAESDRHAHLPVTEDADGLTCDICGAELADWAAADEHVEQHEGWVG